MVEDQFEVDIKIIIVSIDFATGIKYILSTKVDGCELPHKILIKRHSFLDNNTLIEDTVGELCQSYFNLDMAWVNPELFMTIATTSDGDNDIVYIYFASVIPLNTPLKDSFFIPIQSTYDPTIVKAGRDLL